ncbi:MAG TPA: hypothetical protein VGL59_20960 [Polyangia bacterium]
MAAALTGAVVLSLATVALTAPGVPTNNRHTGGDERLKPLHAYEEQRHEHADFRALPTGDAVTGPDPYVVRVLPKVVAGGDERLVSILRGAAQVLLLDANLRVVSSAATPRAPTGLTVAADGDVFVSSEQSPLVSRYHVTADGLQPAGTLTVNGVRAVRDLAAGDAGILYASDEIGGRLLTLRFDAKSAGDHLSATQKEISVGHGPIRVARVGTLLLVDCLLDHAVVVFRIAAAGAPGQPLARVQHDGPIWSFDAVTTDADHALLVVGGVEDHPLDRTGGSFGYVDSFLTVYRLNTRGPTPPARLALINLSALGVVTPKVVTAQLGAGNNELRVLVSGYGTSPLLTLTWPANLQGEPVVAAQDLVPGTTSVASLADGTMVFADPLLDAWVVRSPTATRLVAVRDALTPAPVDARDPLDRVGEALLFTTLMAPWNRSDAELSRFTCETCHFEMYGDGRIHHTGRGDVHAVTKPLRGLFNNRPHFSRALDPDLTTVANNEFRVAGAKSDHDPWFTVATDDFPWLRALGVTQPSLPPLTLRKALMTALMQLGHAPNPAVTPGGHFTDAERAGAALFRDRCEGCHQARLASDDAATRAPFAQWESLIMTDSDPLVWGQAEYVQTGVTPYVHESGARIPSLRRLYKKYPYFTNGSAKDLDAVLSRARFGGDVFWHDGAPAEPTPARLNLQEIDRLRAFLDLL